MHFFSQLPKYMLISHLTDYFFSLMTYPIYTVSLQVIFKICTIFVGDWWYRQWFWGGSMKSKAQHIISKKDNFCYHAYTWLSHNQYNSCFFLLLLFCNWLDKFTIISSEISKIAHTLWQNCPKLIFFYN